MEFKIKSILYVILSTCKRVFYQDMFFGHLSYDSEDFNTSLNTRRSINVIVECIKRETV